MPAATVRIGTELTVAGCVLRLTSDITSIKLFQMKLYLLVQPQDYSRAFVDIFKSKEEALEYKKTEEANGYKVEYWLIKEEEV